MNQQHSSSNDWGSAASLSWVYAKDMGGTIWLGM